MIARVLDIPDEEAATATWLDEQLIGLDLHELVAELAAVHDVPPPAELPSPATAAAWFGEALPDLLDRGTAALDAARFGGLLRAPWLLPAVQELVFVDGGEHWRQVMDRVAPRSGGGASGDRIVAVPQPAVRGNRVPAAVAALAATVVFALATWSLLQPAASRPWGWNLPEALAAAAPAAYLENLAVAAGEWFAEETVTEAALARRLRDLLAGCDRLIAASHTSLAAADREWLVDRCRAWRESIDGHLVALSASHDVAAVRAAADGTVAKLVTALRKQAREISSRSGES